MFQCHKATLDMASRFITRWQLVEQVCRCCKVDSMAAVNISFGHIAASIWAGQMLPIAESNGDTKRTWRRWRPNSMRRAIDLLFSGRWIFGRNDACRQAHVMDSAARADAFIISISGRHIYIHQSNGRGLVLFPRFFSFRSDLDIDIRLDDCLLGS